jgi:glycerol uptake facilitator-like aquaporin
MARRLAAEALGTALLLVAVIGSAILGDHLRRVRDAIDRKVRAWVRAVAVPR